MPSNKDLIKKANELAAELGLEITTEDLNNAELVALVSDLNAKKKDADNPAAEEAQAKAAAVKEEAGSPVGAEAEARPPYSVAKGKAITTRRGVRADGDEIIATDFVGGQKIIDGFVKTGHIVKA